MAHVLKTLNERYNYGLKLVLLSIDEGITGELPHECTIPFHISDKIGKLSLVTQPHSNDSIKDSKEKKQPLSYPYVVGYRDDSLETVKRNRDQYEIPLKILSYEELYGWTMDKIVEKVGRKNNCTFCGVFRRQALDRGALMLGVNKICTGHNADDIAETVVMNILRGDVARLQVLRARFFLIKRG